MKMKKLKLPGKGFILNKVLKALEKDVGLELPFTFEEEKTSSSVSPAHSYYSHKQFRDVMLRADRLRAEVTMEIRKRNPV